VRFAMIILRNISRKELVEKYPSDLYNYKNFKVTYINDKPIISYVEVEKKPTENTKEIIENYIQSTINPLDILELKKTNKGWLTKVIVANPDSTISIKSYFILLTNNDTKIYEVVP